MHRFRAASRSAHPDKNDGSTAAFERVSAAHDCLGDPEKRAAYDRGDDLDRGFERDGTTQGMPFSERVLRRYFPEDFKYEPFGDPFERKRDYEREKRRRAPARPPPRPLMQQRCGASQATAECRPALPSAAARMQQ